MTTKQTKIVATISDWRSTEDFIRELYESGMNVVRMNSAHLSEEGFRKIISNTRAVSKNIAILMDTKGPEIRTTAIENDAKINFQTGDILKFVGNPDVLTSKECIALNYKNFVTDLSTGLHILIDDGELDFLVTEKHEDYLVGVAQNNGELGSRKSVNVPGVRINLPSLTEKDRINIQYAIDMGVDFIAHSFVRNRQDILDIQQILDAHNSPIKIIAKIENQEGVDNIDEILEVAYGVMVARGDLGIEVPQEKIPGIQRLLIKKCVQAKKPVIVATQMLHSMINNPRPTRAEVTDIANAIYYRTDALMLSGETAYGKYPVEAVKTMASIALEAEKTKMPENDIPVPIIDGDISLFMAKQAVDSTTKLQTKAIVTDSHSGRTARLIAAYRANRPVIAICYQEHLIRELALSYGVRPMYLESKGTARDYFFNGLTMMLENKMVSPEDRVAYVGGSFGEGGGTTFLEVNTVGKIMEHSSDYILPHFKSEDK
ncbi:MAG: pyruvate kinase [Bacteroidales bacterium]